MQRRERLQLEKGRGWQEPARGTVRKSQGELRDAKGSALTLTRDGRVVQRGQSQTSNLSQDDLQILRITVLPWKAGVNPSEPASPPRQGDPGQHPPSARQQQHVALTSRRRQNMGHQRRSDLGTEGWRGGRSGQGVDRLVLTCVGRLKAQEGETCREAGSHQPLAWHSVSPHFLEHVLSQDFPRAPRTTSQLGKACPPSLGVS